MADETDHHYGKEYAADNQYLSQRHFGVSATQCFYEICKPAKASCTIVKKVNQLVAHFGHPQSVLTKWVVQYLSALKKVCILAQHKILFSSGGTRTI